MLMQKLAQAASPRDTLHMHCRCRCRAEQAEAFLKFNVHYSRPCTVHTKRARKQDSVYPDCGLYEKRHSMGCVMLSLEQHFSTFTFIFHTMLH